MSNKRVYQLQREDTGQVVLKGVQCATTFWSRLVGLQFRKTLLDWCGLLIVPCGSVHTGFVRFPIDVVFLSDDGTVNEIRRAVPPWKIVTPENKAHAVLETAPQALDVVVGTRLSLKLSRDGELPKALEFMMPTTELRDVPASKIKTRRLRDIVART